MQIGCIGGRAIVVVWQLKLLNIIGLVESTMLEGAIDGEV
jgi:hypothetical protein